MRPIAVGPAARDVWREVLGADPSAMISQTPAWLDCVCAAGPYADATRAYETADGRTVVLPLVRLRWLPDPATVEASMPWGWRTGGAVSPRGSPSSQDVAAVAADLAEHGALRVAIRPGPAAERAWARGVPDAVVRTRHMVQSVDLTGGFGDVWSRRFTGSVRRACKKAERSRLEVEWDDTGRLVGVFDALYRTSVARWAEGRRGGVRVAEWRSRLREPRRKYEIVAERLGPACRVWMAWRSGEPAAALIVSPTVTTAPTGAGRWTRRSKPAHARTTSCTAS